jgi:hypothetical protein
MADKRSEYVVPVNGIDHVFLLTEEDAEKYPDAKKSSGNSASRKIAEEASKSVAAQNKAYTDSTNK